MKDLEISNVCSERLFARHDSVISHTNSYELLLHMHDLHKVKPDKIPAWRERGGHEVLSLA